MNQTPQCLGALGVACLLAVAPLAAGCGIFLLWCATEWDFLPGVGVLNIMFGVLAVVVAACCLVVHLARIAGASPYRWGELAKIVAIAGVMALNFPVCITIIDTFFRLRSFNRMRDDLAQSCVRVINLADEPIAAAAVTGMRFSAVRSIARGEGASFFFEPMDNSKLTVRWDDSGDRNVTVALPPQHRETTDAVALVRSSGDDGIEWIAMTPRQADSID